MNEYFHLGKLLLITLFCVKKLALCASKDPRNAELSHQYERQTVKDGSLGTVKQEERNKEVAGVCS